MQVRWRYTLSLLFFSSLLFAQEGEPPLMQLQREAANYESSFIKTIALFIGFILLILLTMWLFKKLSYGRMSASNSLKAIKILERRPLSPKSMLYLVEVSGKQVLIAESQVQVSLLSSINWEEPDPSI